jgi:hypothetical protein
MICNSDALDSHSEGDSSYLGQNTVWSEISSGYSLAEGEFHRNFNPYRLSMQLWNCAGMNRSTVCIGNKRESVLIVTFGRPTV